MPQCLPHAVLPPRFSRPWLLCIAFFWALHCGWLHAGVQPRNTLPNLDRRPGTLLTRAAPLSPASQAAEARLKSLLPSVRIDYDPISRSAVHIRCLDGCLTGPGGAGSTISRRTLASIPEAQAHRALRAFLQEYRPLIGVGPEMMESSNLIREQQTERTGLRSLVYRQHCRGIQVYEAALIGHLTGRGELLAVSSRCIPDVDKAADQWEPNRPDRITSPAVPPEDAIVTAALSLGILVSVDQILPLTGKPDRADQSQDFSAPAIPGRIQCRLVWLPMTHESIQLCWQVELTRPQGGERHRALVDARGGQLMLRRCLTVYAAPETSTFEVFTSDSPSPFSPGLKSPGTAQPPLVPRDRITLTAFSTNASPFGWITSGDNETKGNNVHAHLDLDADDEPDLPRPQGNPYRVFAPPLDLTLPASANRDAAVVQLFYWCNQMHDWLYDLGFTEAAGNFQKENFGRGGLGGDPIMADAQDGSGVNNANFTPTDDGEPGRIQMFVFDGAKPTRDGDLDAEIILHEYTHGLSTRLVGGGLGLSTLQSEGLGEGWSDFFALSLLSSPADDPDAPYAMGAYVTRLFFGLEENYYFGIRRYPYSTDFSINPLRFRDIDGAQISNYPDVPRSPVFPFSPGLASEPHNQGEVWCVTLWDARAAMIHKYGWEKGNTLILQLVTDGMKLSPPNPNFLQARDAILQADLVANAGSNLNELWAAFARRGMGFNAKSPVSSFTSGVVEAFDLPDALRLDHPQGFVFVTPAGGPVLTSCQTLQITNTQATPARWTLGNTADWLSVEPGAGTLPAFSSISIQVCLKDEVNQLEVGRLLSSLTLTNEDTGVTQSRNLDLQILRFGGLPFSDDFEGGEMRPEWFVATPSYGRVRITSLGGPHGGSTHLMMDSDSDGLFARNEVTLGVDARGWTNLTLHFWAKKFSDEPNPAPPSPFVDGADADMVSISLNGRDWYEIQSLSQLTATNREFTVAIDKTIRAYHLHYGERFLVRLTQFDNFPFPIDGIAFDDLTLDGSPVGRYHLEITDSPVENAAAPTFAAVVLSQPQTVDTRFNLTSSDPQTATVPESIVVKAGTTRAEFEVRAPDNSLLDGTRNVQLSAHADGFYGPDLTVGVIDDETATLTLNLPSEVIENAGVLNAQGRVVLDRAPALPILIHLSSGNPKRLVVPESVIVPAGSTEASFDLTVPDDIELEGTTQVSLKAELPGSKIAEAFTRHIDNETPSLILRLPTSLSEDTPPELASVTLGGTVTTNVVVRLLWDEQALNLETNAIVIPAGSLSTTFRIGAQDNLMADGTHQGAIKADADGFISTQGGITVLDDETPPLVYSPRPRAGSSNQPPNLELTWMRGFGDILVNGDFEAGSLTGWQTVSEEGRGWVIDDGTVNPDGPGLPTPPFEGKYGAVLAQQAGGFHRLFQDVTLPSDAKSAMLIWHDLIQNQSPEYLSPVQQYRVEILDTRGKLLETAFTTKAGDPLQTEWTERRFDLTKHRGETIRIQFREDDTLGFINVWLDAVHLDLGTTGQTGFEVYMSAPDVPSPLALLDTVFTNRLELRGLNPLSLYTWQVVAVRNGVRTPGPVWNFRVKEVGDVATLKWDSFPTEIVSGVPFAASLSALDSFGLVATQFNGGLTLRAVAGAASENTVVISEVDQGNADAVEFSNVSGGKVDISGWQVFMYDASRWPSARTNFVFPPGTLLRPGDVFVLNERGVAPGKFPVFNLGSRIDWGPPLISQPTGVVLIDQSSNLVDVVGAVEGDPFLFRTPYRMPAGAWTGPPLPPMISTNNTWQRIGSSNHRSPADWVIAASNMGQRNPDLQIPFPPTQLLTVRPDSSVAMSGGRWSGNLVLEGNLPSVTLRADDGFNHANISPAVPLKGDNDLALLRTERPTFSIVDNSFVVAYEIRNSGPSPASGAVLSCYFPPELVLESAEFQGLPYSSIESGVRFSLPDLAANSPLPIRLRFKSGTPGRYPLVAELQPGSEDTFSGNNRVEDPIEIVWPSLVVSDITRDEGNSGTNLFTFNIRLLSPIQREVRVKYATVDAGATAGTDYIATSGEAVFPPGVTNQPVSVPVLGDTLYEVDERFLLRLSDPVNATISDGEAKATINEEESAPSLQVSGGEVAEGPVGSRTEVIVPVQLSGASSLPIRVNYFTANGTALALSDYISTRGQLTFSPGVTQINLSIPILGDNRIEGNETFQVVLSNAVNAQIRIPKATVTIKDDDSGELGQLRWSATSRTQFVKQPFAVNLRALDGNGAVLTRFAEPVTVRAFTQPRVATPEGLSNAWAFPLRSFFHDARGQFLYLPTELGAAGLLTELSLPVETLPGQILRHFTLRLKQVPELELKVRDWESEGWTNVLSADLAISEFGLLRFPVDPPFTYDGIRGVMVDISFDNDFYTSDGLCTAVETDGFRGRVFETDSAFGSPLQWEGSWPPAALTNRVPRFEFAIERPVPLQTRGLDRFTDGQWSGEITILTPADQVQIAARTLSGIEALTEPFAVASESTTVTRPQIVDITIEASGLTLRFQGTKDQLYQLESLDSFSSDNWKPIGPAIPGDPAGKSILDPSGAIFPHRFYRLRLIP